MCTQQVAVQITEYWPPERHPEGGVVGEHGSTTAQCYMFKPVHQGIGSQSLPRLCISTPAHPSYILYAVRPGVVRPGT